ncbi:GNAT family N-acetyltransferase [Pseudalkalibacillus caeni]|uniref:GNAT family N-acetyltransferase n=1 Tax=Exobacillus caeni TaxID=2574798 RepID=A0A5R9F5A1_9BACL|nr:GNAT family N-acetyltransferase [Pseudalkalibacillus caeni]TLS38211.1 GNAT family N-acetyltransferase [Pseudalkalibacillus caeni]
MNIIIEKALRKDKSVLKQLMEFYLYDFSEFINIDVNEHGYYGYTYIDHYWTDENRWPFFIKVDGNFAGFVLVLQDKEEYYISEFFVMKRYRRNGVGKLAAFEAFKQFKGKWIVTQILSNKPAQHFWRSAISEFTGGDFVETTDENVVKQVFVS